MWARLVLQLPAVGGRMPTEHGMHKHSADAIADPGSQRSRSLLIRLSNAGVCPLCFV